MSDALRGGHLGPTDEGDVELDLRGLDAEGKSFRLWTGRRVLCDRAKLNDTTWNGSHTQGEVSFVDAELRDAKMRGVYFNPYLARTQQGPSISGVDFTRSDLSNADLATSSMPRSNFSGANGVGLVAFASQFPDARLLGANFSGANFDHSNLRGSLGGIQWTTAEITAFINTQCAHLEEGSVAHTMALTNLLAAIGHAQITQRPASLANASLIGSRLKEVRWNGVVLVGANMKGADCHKADLRGADLQGADLTGANLEGARLSGAKVAGANFRETNVEMAILDEGRCSTRDLLLKQGAIL